MTKQWFKAAAIRALKTFAQAAIAVIPTSALLSEVNWLMVLSTAAVAAILSILTSIMTTLPEVELSEELEAAQRAYKRKEGEHGAAE